jgi:hypothetical protein
MDERYASNAGAIAGRSLLNIEPFDRIPSTLA